MLDGLSLFKNSRMGIVITNHIFSSTIKYGLSRRLGLIAKVQQVVFCSSKLQRAGT
ncbi:MAG: hypothetical protein ACJAVI_005140 [Candidatus Azotimanducaceae bacterium]